ncbi:MAG: hydrogen gas-evolving membrane-bound hydrogenase subunit E [Desulfobacterales bacterium]
MENSLNLAAVTFDGVLALVLLVLAWQLLRSPNLFKAIVLFISFGLMLSLAWVRLKAVDIALAEAAIGAGLTGALFLTALDRLQRNNQKVGDSLISQPGKAIAAISVLVLICILGWTVWTLPPFSDQMSALVSSNMPISGVENPVTAVLLNFRGYDTLLEIGVLLLAAVGVLAVTPSAVMVADSAPSPILILLLRLLLPFIILVSGYILWIGKYAPGGAFQAGAVLAAGGILLATAAVRFNLSASKALPLATGIGLLIFLLVALATMMLRGNYLQYPVAQAGTLILVIEAAATLSIAAVLVLLFVTVKSDADCPAPGEDSKNLIFEEENTIK